MMEVVRAVETAEEATEVEAAEGREGVAKGVVKVDERELGGVAARQAVTEVE